MGSRDCKNSSQQSGDDGPMALPQILIWSNDVNILLLFIHYTNLFRGLDGRGVRVILGSTEETQELQLNVEIGRAHV